MSKEYVIMMSAAGITLGLFVFAVDWRGFRDWIAVFLFQGLVGLLWGGAVVQLKMIEYPVRLWARYFDSSIFFELWIFPVLGILYNQAARGGYGAALGYALLFAAGITAVEYPLERYTDLIKYNTWSPGVSFFTIVLFLLLSRAFLAVYRWGCSRFGGKREVS